MHEHWGEQPDWKPDERGIITNSDYFGGDLKGIEEKLPYLKRADGTLANLNIWSACVSPTNVSWSF